MSKSEKSIRTLTQLGLTFNQARAYLTLVKIGSANAKEISKASSIALQDVYRVIPALQRLGLVEKAVASPSLFKANSPKQAISVLLKRREKENQVLYEESKSLMEELEERGARNTTKEQDTSQFSIISGRKTIMEKSKKAITEAKQSICVLTPWKYGAKNTLHFLTLSRRALSRQVEIRFIFYLPEQETDTFSKKMGHLIEDRRFKAKFIFTEKPVVLSVFDREQVFFVTDKGGLGDAPILWSDNLRFASLAQDYFDMLWEIALENLKSAKEKTNSPSHVRQF